MRRSLSRVRRFFLRYRWCREYEKSLNRRAKVEDQLLQVACGKAPLPDREQCKQWALELGVPEEWR